MSEGIIDRLKARAPKGSFSSQIFTWVGIVGATITLVGNLSTLITLANWCRSLVALYHTSLEQVAAWLSAWLKVELDPASVAFGLYFFFLVSMAVGARLGSRDSHLGLKQRALISVLLFFGLIGVYRLEVHILGTWELGRTYYTFAILIFIAALALNYSALRSWRPVLAVFALTVLLYLAHWTMNTGKLYNLFTLWGLSDVSVFGVLSGNAPPSLLVVSFVLLLAPIIPHAISPYRPLLQRMSFIAIGVAILLGLSEISKLLGG